MQHARSLGALVTAELSGSATSLVLAIAAVIGVAAMDLLAPWPLKFVFDHVLLDVPPPAQATLLTGLLERDTELTLLLAAGAIVVIALANALFSYLHLTVMARLGLQLTHRLRAELFARVQRLSLAFHQRNRTGELLTRIAADTE
ncbi:MAG: ABC transporter transmembrane domain-containing protein, partial [Gammaproteobacteria bacterium]